jgi:hypothetical protein
MTMARQEGVRGHSSWTLDRLEADITPNIDQAA